MLEIGVCQGSFLGLFLFSLSPFSLGNMPMSILIITSTYYYSSKGTFLDFSQNLTDHRPSHLKIPHLKVTNLKMIQD